MRRCDDRRVGSCCDPRGYEQVFDDRFARRQAARYRRRGLDRTSRRIVELVTERGVDGASVLEVGGGVGEIQLELLKRGAVRATNVDLSPAYEAEAQRLLADAGLTARVQRRVADLAADPDGVAAAEIVVLNRVVCCYPDYEKLLRAVAEHAERLVVFSHPPRNALSRAVIGAQNSFLRLRGSPFRIFAHPPKAMLDVLAAHGLPATAQRRTFPWRIAVADRSAHRQP